jgi:AcrR family transcriptional regulator
MAVMPRWEPDAPERLARAAFELFSEQGFDDTTVPQIAERAGLTTRSFFRHFTDKREVLFVGDDEIPGKVAGLLSAAPASLGLMDTLTWGVEAMAETFFEGTRDQCRLRRAIIEANPGLQERELRKQSEVAVAISEALAGSGVDALTATVAGKIAVAISSTAISAWIEAADDRPLVDHVRDARRAVTEVTTDALGLT